MDVVHSLVQHLLSLLLFSFSCGHNFFFVFKVFFLCSVFLHNLLNQTNSEKN